MLTITLSFLACILPTDGCYDYETGVIHINPKTVTPYILTHEVGHHFYFRVLDADMRSKLSVGDPNIMEEEAWADVYAACILGRGPRWMKTHGYRVQVELNRFKHICKTIKRGR